jgi:hypothetical protein
MAQMAESLPSKYEAMSFVSTDQKGKAYKLGALWSRAQVNKYKEPDSNYFQFCRLDSLFSNYPILPWIGGEGCILWRCWKCRLKVWLFIIFGWPKPKNGSIITTF